MRRRRCSPAAVRFVPPAFLPPGATGHHETLPARASARLAASALPSALGRLCTSRSCRPQGGRRSRDADGPGPERRRGRRRKALFSSRAMCSPHSRYCANHARRPAPGQHRGARRLRPWSPGMPSDGLPRRRSRKTWPHGPAARACGGHASPDRSGLRNRGSPSRNATLTT
jgi:hypothetical protein